jgi:hypothetical protein
VVSRSTDFADSADLKLRNRCILRIVLRADNERSRSTDLQEQLRTIEQQSVRVQNIATEQNPCLAGAGNNFDHLHGQIMDFQLHRVRRHRLHDPAHAADGEITGAGSVIAWLMAEFLEQTTCTRRL